MKRYLSITYYLIVHVFIRSWFPVCFVFVFVETFLYVSMKISEQTNLQTVFFLLIFSTLSWIIRNTKIAIYIIFAFWPKNNYSKTYTILFKDEIIFTMQFYTSQIIAQKPMIGFKFYWCCGDPRRTGCKIEANDTKSIF